MTMKMAVLPPRAKQELGYGKASILLNSDVTKVSSGFASAADLVVNFLIFFV